MAKTNTSSYQYVGDAYDEICEKLNELVNLGYSNNEINVALEWIVYEAQEADRKRAKTEVKQ